MSAPSIVLDWMDCASWIDGVEYRLGKIPTREPLQRLLAGGIAGAFSRTGIPPRTWLSESAGAMLDRGTICNLEDDRGHVIHI
jgi:hypothetical protein